MLHFEYMVRKKQPRPTGKKKGRAYHVSAAEKAELLKALKEADDGGALPFDDAMAEVERTTEEILDVVHGSTAPSK